MTYYAVGFPKGTIELRESDTPLKKVVTKFSKPVTYKTYGYNSGMGYGLVDRKTTISFDVTVIAGGTVIGTIDGPRFTRILMTDAPIPNQVKEITPQQLQTILRRVRKFKDDPRRQRKTRLVRTPRADRTDR